MSPRRRQPLDAPAFRRLGDVHAWSALPCAHPLHLQLQTLPREPEYARVAAQLREIASVSPSLGDWLQEVPRLSMPLGASIETLEEAAAELDRARTALETALGGQ